MTLRVLLHLPRMLLAAGILTLAVAGNLSAQNRGDDPTAAHWPMDQIVMENGREYSGLIRNVGPHTVEFIEIRRPPGRPMFALVRPIEGAAVASARRLSAEQRELLEARLDRQFYSRAAIEAGRMESVDLAAVRLDGHDGLRFRGPWFQLDSTADRQMTRRFVVRLEQMFLAYRQVLPPRRSPADIPVPRIVVYGNNDHYHRHLRQREITMRNPAYFAPDLNLVVAGSDVQRYARQLAAAQSQHADALRKYEAMNRQFPVLLARLQKELESQGASKEDRQDVRNAAWARWNRQQEALNEAVKQAERANANVLDTVAGEMLTRLYHEAFHAYLENYVYPSDTYRVPLWLNEGLAQIFEAGILDADTLRIDAPAADALATVQAEIRAGGALRLAQLLSARQSTFLVAHETSASTSTRHYHYSWALTYYLAFEKSLLDTPELEQYVSRDRPALSASTRFERLVGMPLAEFETQWQTYLLGLKAPRR